MLRKDVVKAKDLAILMHPASVRGEMGNRKMSNRDGDRPIGLIEFSAHSC